MANPLKTWAKIKQSSWEKYLWDQGKDLKTPNPGPLTIAGSQGTKTGGVAVVFSFSSHPWDESDIEYTDMVDGV